MLTSEATNEIAQALATAQGVMAGAKKDVSNPFFKSRYADLASVWEACREALSKNGIAVIQMTEPTEKDEVCVVTRLAHKSGQWYEGRLCLPVSKADAQGYGSALTYARRYALAASVGVAPEDDDGNLATQAKPLPSAIPANIEGKTMYEALSDEEKDFYRTHADRLKGLYSLGDADAMVEYVRKEMRPTHEDLLVLWHVLKDESKLRSAYTAAAKKKPTTADFAMQA